VLPAEDGKSVYIVACPRRGRDLVVRHVQPVGTGRRLKVIEGTVRMPAALGGVPAVVGTQLVVPLADGVLARLPLPLPPGMLDPDLGQNWRAPRAAPEARGQVIALGSDRFLTTNGARGLTTWQWPANRECEPLPLGRDSATTLELEERIVSSPLRLPDKGKGLVRVCVADSAGKVSLVEVEEDGNLRIKRSWDVGGQVTAGPFLTGKDGQRIGCIVQHSRLVWIDPTREELLWTYATAKGDAIVGRPRIAGGMVVVADQSGLYLGLNPATGHPVGQGYRLRGSVAAVASPVEFTAGRLLAPLSDGTVVLLAAERLRKK
jgi:hypothetical protein